MSTTNTDPTDVVDRPASPSRPNPTLDAPQTPVAQREVRLHDQRVTYLESGARTSGPTAVLLHGLAGSSMTWAPVLPLLGRRAHVIAPDLLGHGESAKPASGDYALGAYAAAVRDLLVILGLDHATVIGHSFGGGVAMQFAYQFPELTERLVLVASGGLGRELTPVLRAATLPGATLTLRALTALTPRWLGRLVHRGIRAVPGTPKPELDEAARALTALSDQQARGAFAQTVSSVLDVSGQRLDGLERLQLANTAPLLLIAGGRDSIIPVQHTVRAHRLLPGSRVEVFPDAGHFPHVDHPERFAEVVLEFLATTEPARPDLEDVRRRLRTASGSAPRETIDG
jgi:pimeloyl-ACP methyl ester carboxylesterase